MSHSYTWENTIRRNGFLVSVGSEPLAAQGDEGRWKGPPPTLWLGRKRGQMSLFQKKAEVGIMVQVVATKPTWWKDRADRSCPLASL